VLIDVPVDVSKGEVDFVYPASVNLPGYKPTYRGHAKQIKQAANLIAKARKPLLYIGGGVLASNASKEVKELAELMQLPVTSTLMGKGAFPEDHHLSIGMPGMHGAKYTNYSITETDLLIGVGVRFDDRVTGKLAAFASKAKVIHVDIDPAEIGKNKPVDVPIVGDAKNVVAALVAELRKMGAEPRTDAWMRAIDDWRSRFPLHYHKESATIMPQRVVERIDELTAGRETSSAPRSARTRCGRCSSTRRSSRATGCPRAVWARWASASRPLSALRPADPTRSSSTSPATARSRW
jgi:acetolactate synthase I/II/III large subunit